MRLANLLRETLDGEAEDVWENERTPTPVRRFGARFQSMGLSVRGTEAVLGWLGVQRSHGAVWRWNHRLADSNNPPTVQPQRVAVDETAVQIDGEWHWVYAAIDVETKLLLDIELFSHRGTDPAAAFLHRLAEKHNLIADLTGFEGEVEWDTSKPDGQPRRRLDTFRAKARFGWEAETEFEEGLRETIDGTRRIGTRSVNEIDFRSHSVAVPLSSSG